MYFDGLLKIVKFFTCELIFISIYRIQFANKELMITFNTRMTEGSQTDDTDNLYVSSL